jgi:hypothetical protein
MRIVTNSIKLIIALLFFLTPFHYSQIVPDFDWSIKGGGTARDAAYSVTVDLEGNVYLTGEFFSASVAFPNLTITGAGTTGNCDFFLAKFDPAGQGIWGIKGGGTLTDRGYGVKLDNNGYLYTTGHFFGQATFGSYTLNSSGNLDCFTAKLDTSGNYIWMKEGKSVSQVSTRQVAVDYSGNVIIVGYYGSATVDSVNFDGLKITTNGQRDIFVVKYNNDGVVQWGVTAGGLVSGEQANDVVVDAAGNIYVTGVYNDTATFSGTVLNGLGGSEIFVAKYSPNGQLAWAKSAGGIGADEGSGIAVDGQGNVYVCGRYDSAAYFGTTSQIGNGDLEAFLAKYDQNGNLLWVVSGGGPGNDYFSSIAIDNEGYIQGIGSFTGTATFGTNNLTALAGSEDLFFIKYNPAGLVQWVKQAGGSGSDKANAVCIDPGGNLLGTGFFNGTAFFGLDTLISSGTQDIYVTKIGNNPIPVELVSFKADISKGVVTLKWSTATETNNKGFEIERSFDKTNFNKIGFVDGFGTTTEKKEYTFIDKSVLNGKAYYRLRQIDFDGTFSYSSIVEVDAEIPLEFGIEQNYPNPFNPSTTIAFNLPVDANVTISVFNMLGEEVEILLNKEMNAGKHSVIFDAKNYTSGTYIYTVKSVDSFGKSNFSAKKMILIK